MTIIHNPKSDIQPHTVRFISDLGKEKEINFVIPAEMEAFIKLTDLKCQVDGTRMDEFTRTEKSSDLIQNGENVSRENMQHFVENGIFGLTILYPIYDWTEDEVWKYINANNIEISKEYNL
jgi:3'-phosphoadenosine 5'-phosphosulfate sulfotransferase (PAPS reductase)/FAD synthetase